MCGTTSAVCVDVCGLTFVRVVGDSSLVCSRWSLNGRDVLLITVMYLYPIFKYFVPVYLDVPEGPGNPSTVGAAIATPSVTLAPMRGSCPLNVVRREN